MGFTVPEGKRPPFDSHYLIVNSTTLSPTFVEGSYDSLTESYFTSL